MEPCSPQPALPQAVAPGRPAQSPIGRRRRNPGTRRPGSRRRALEGPAAGGSQRAATAGHEAWSLAAPRWPGPRPHHSKPQFARLWGTQSVTERAPGGARPRACPPFLGPGTRARHNKSPSVPPPAAAEGLTHIRGFESAARHVTRRQGGAGRKPTRAQWVRVFRARGPGFPRVAKRSPSTSGVHRFQRRRPVLSTELQSHFFTARCAEWNGAPMATLDLPLALPHWQGI